MKLRLGSFPLNSSTFNPLSPCDTTVCCYYCNEVENEKQLIYVCPLYDNIRARYLNGIMTGRQSGIIYYDVILFMLQRTLERLYFMQCVFWKIIKFQGPEDKLLSCLFSLSLSLSLCMYVCMCIYIYLYLYIYIYIYISTH